MDELDSAIIRQLQLNARQTNRELARLVGVAPSTCLERVRSLVERGVIRGTTPRSPRSRSTVASRRLSPPGCAR